MSFGLVVGVLVGSIALLVGIMLGVRKWLAPGGGHFRDSDRASSVFGFVGAGFAIMLGFVVLLSFQSYNGAKAQAEDEATAVFEQYEVAALFQPKAARDVLWGQIVCYARAVVYQEWPAMKHGHRSPAVDTWIERLEAEIPSADIVNGASPAYQQWFEKSADRDNARRQRLVEAAGTLPSLLWVMLILGAVTVLGFILLYADPEERWLGQAFFAGGTTAVIVISLLAVALLASPFQGGNGSVQPGGMRYTLQLIESEAALLHEPLATPCDARGNPT
jgi:hypothetical protein